MNNSPNIQQELKDTIDTENSYMQYGEPMIPNSNDAHGMHISGHKKFRQSLIENGDDDDENALRLLDAHIELHEEYESLI